MILACAAAGGSATSAAEFADVVRPFIAEQAVTGAVVLVTDRDRTLLHDATGQADVAAGRAMAPDSLFWIASMTKPITAAAIMILVDEGTVRLDEPLATYLPEFRDCWLTAEQDAGHMTLRRPRRPITVRDALAHTGGLPFMSPVETPTLDSLPLAVAVRCCAQLPLLFEPGSAYQYSNAGINACGRVIEVVAGMPYEEFLETRLFRPLGMTDTTFRPTAAQVARIATSYRRDAATNSLVPVAIDQLKYPLDGPGRYPMPGGGLFSTAADCGRFCRMLLGGGAVGGVRILSEAAVREMRTRQTPEEVKEAYGLGIQIHADGRYGHGGAYATDLAVDDARGIAMVWLVQDASPEKPSKACKAAVDEWLATQPWELARAATQTCGDRNLPLEQLYPPEAFHHAGRGGRLLDVTKPPFNAKGDGVTDDTAALRAALRFVAESYEPLTGDGWSYCGCKLDKSWIIYLPAGEYLVRDTLDQGWPVRVWSPRDGWSTIRRTTLASPEEVARRRPEHWAAENFCIRIVGQSRAKTVIRLADACPGFEAGQAKAVVAFHQGIFSNVSQGNYVENITIATGTGNPGAVALRWSAANWGGVRNVLLRSGDGRGRVGLAMDVPCVEGYLRDVTVDGFETGIDLGVGNAANVAVLEHATVKNQSVAGIRVGKHHDCLDARKVLFENVPTALKVDNGSHVVLLESRAVGAAGAQAAITVAEHGHLLLRDFAATGFEVTIVEAGKEPLRGAAIAAHDTEPVVTVPGVAPARPVPASRDMPVVLPEPDLAKWADVQAFGAAGDGVTDDTAAIQRACDSGRPVVWFPRANYVIDGTVDIPATVREICFLHASVYRSKANGSAMFRVAEPATAPLLLKQNVNAGGVFVDHEADRPLVLEDVQSWFHHTRSYARDAGMLFAGPAAQTDEIWQLYRNTRPKGAAKEVHAANVMGFAVGGPDGRLAIENVHAWVRQLDNEHIPGAQAAFRNCDVWLLGFKTENAPLLFHATAGTRLVIFGGVDHVLGDHARGAMIVAKDSDVAAAFVVWSGGSHQPAAIESVTGGTTTTIPTGHFPLINSRSPPASDTVAGTLVITLATQRQ